MNVLQAVAGNVRIGWKSPVCEVVNPAFIALNGRGGLGWLEDFNEMVVRCGYEWVGHPGMDKGVLLPLHGLAANIPASKVVLSIDEEPPYTIRLKLPTIGPKEQRHFDITYTFLGDKSAADSALQQVQKIQHDRPTEVRKSPFVDLPKS
jgi:hypothetical protein